MPRTGRAGWNRCLLGTTVLALGGCTAILDFSEPIETTDAAVFDATPSAPDATPAVCSTFEPNGSLAEATTITAMEVASAVCGEDDSDIFAFAVSDEEDVSITLTFNVGIADDLDLRLLDATGAAIDDSTGPSNTQQINRTSALSTGLAAGTYHIEVVPTAVASLVEYSVNLSITAR